MLKYFLIVLSCCWMTLQAQETVKKSGYTFEVHKQEWAFSTDFEIDSHGELLGKVVKSAFTLRTCYDLYNSYNGYQATGVCRILTLGSLFAWGTEIDVQNARGDPVGVIDGQCGTLQAARFSIYDHGVLAGVAYLDSNCKAFTIYDPHDHSRIIARLSRQFVEGTVDHWIVTVYDPRPICKEIIEIFAAFVCDSQASFKEDN